MPYQKRDELTGRAEADWRKSESILGVIVPSASNTKSRAVAMMLIYQPLPRSAGGSDEHRIRSPVRRLIAQERLKLTA
jgi:hypothetical protein